MSANASIGRRTSSIRSLGSESTFESPWIRTKTLTGDRPRCETTPSEKYVDDESGEVIFYWQDDDDASWQISICRLGGRGVCKWENITVIGISLSFLIAFTDMYMSEAYPSFQFPRYLIFRDAPLAHSQRRSQRLVEVWKFTNHPAVWRRRA
jgi:hypothetical protein